MNQGGEIKVWDPLVRLVHWSLVAAFAVVYLTGEEESILHIWSGYAVGVLVALRVLWGFVGTRYARFADFVYRPATVFAYAKDFLRAAPRRYIGPNPLGGAMVIALLLSLAGATLSGLWLYGAEENKGPAAPLASPSSPAPMPTATTRGNKMNTMTTGACWAKSTSFSPISRCCSWCCTSPASF